MSEVNLGKRYFTVGRAVVSLNKTQEDARRTIENLIRDGVYEFESVPCLCASSIENDVLIATTERHGLEHHTVICSACGLVRTNPRLTQASYRDFYQDWYRQLYSGWRHLDEGKFKSQFDSYLVRGERIAAFLRSRQIDIDGKDVLEIGCGGGWNLPAFEKAGAVATGFDYGNYIDLGKDMYGLDLRRGGTKEAINDGITTDVLVLSHTIEHFSDPLGELKDMRQLVSSDGICYLETPGIFNIHNAYIDPMKYFQNAHTYSFSKHTLSDLVKSCGFEVLYCDEFIRMLCRPTVGRPVNVEVEPEHSRQVIEYLRGCENKRLARGCGRSLKLTVVNVLKTLGIYPWARALYRRARPNGKTG